MEAYKAMILERAAKVEWEQESERMYYANLEWIYEHMQQNEGLGVFVHPYWLCPAMHTCFRHLLSAGAQKKRRE